MPVLGTRGGMSAQSYGLFLGAFDKSNASFVIINRGNNLASQSAKYFIDQDSVQDYNYLTSVQRGGFTMSNREKMLTSWGFLSNNQGVTGFTLLNFSDGTVSSGDLLAPSRNGMGASTVDKGLYNTNGTVATASAATYTYVWASGAQAPSTNLTAVANFGNMASGSTTVIACLGNAGRVTNLYTWASAAVVAGPLTPVATVSPVMCVAGNAVTAIFSGGGGASNNNKYTWANNTMVAHTASLVNGSSTAAAAAGNETYGIFNNVSNPTSSNVQNKKLNYASDVSVNGTNTSFTSNTPTAASNGILGVTY